MSIKLTSAVWEHSFTHAQQAVMHALADHANDDGGRVYPGLRLVSWKTGYSLRQVKRTVAELEQMGVLKMVMPARRGRGTEYQISLEAAPTKPPYTSNWGDTVSPQPTSDGVTSAPNGVTSEADWGDICDNAIRKEPSRTTKEPLTEKPGTLPGTTFNATEVAQIVCQQNGWSGPQMIWIFKGALEFQAPRMPEKSLEEVAEWLVARWQGHIDRCGVRFAGKVKDFFAEAKYSDTKSQQSRPSAPKWPGLDDGVSA